MVWFQCESCGENLKKPKLQNHFRGCAARKLSCIDCGVVFDQQSVQAHTSCVTEEEKYGPKGLIKGGSGSTQKVQKEQKPNTADIDLSIGLASKPPWACSLCNVSTTSFETLEGHSQGKKHRSKVKAALGKLNPTVPAEQHNGSAGLIPVNGNLPESTPESKVKLEKDGVVGSLGPTYEEGGGDKKIRKKRKAGAADTNGQENVIAASESLEADVELPGKKKRKEKKGKEENVGIKPTKTVNWNKIFTKVLAKSPNGSMKTRSLMKEVLVVEASKLSPNFPEKKMLEAELLNQLRKSSKFVVEGKVVRLAKPLQQGV
ncbi:unnamed protein product [Sphagnum troendelagicum]|uniref:U1-type domain-containing protein n=2 Tax=Sphagnum TaxID=13804 RepID=A0ABP0UBF1_9BRYO